MLVLQYIRFRLNVESTGTKRLRERYPKIYWLTTSVARHRWFNRLFPRCSTTILPLLTPEIRKQKKSCSSETTTTIVTLNSVAKLLPSGYAWRDNPLALEDCGQNTVKYWFHFSMIWRNKCYIHIENRPDYIYALCSSLKSITCNTDEL